MVEKLNSAGIETVERMVSASASELSEVLGLSEGAAEALRQSAEAATMAAGGAVGSGTTEAVPQEGIEPPPTSQPVVAPIDVTAQEPMPVEDSHTETSTPAKDTEPPASGSTDTGKAPAPEGE
jgi:predicted RecB family nuclease